MKNDKRMQGGSTAIKRQGSQAVIVITENLSGEMDFSHYGYGNAAEFAETVLEYLFDEARQVDAESNITPQPSQRQRTSGLAAKE